MMKYKKPNVYMILMIMCSIVCLVLLVLEWTMDIFNNVKYFTSELVALSLSILQTILIAWFVSGELKKNHRITKQALDLERHGIIAVNKRGELLPSEVIDLFSNTTLVKMMVVCGKTFFDKNLELIKNHLIQGNEIRLLIANEDSEFVQEITSQLNALEAIENGQENHQKEEIKEVLALVKQLKSFGKIEVRQYNTEYRVPFYLGYFESKEQTIIKGWYNSIIPVCSPRETIMLKGEISEEDREKYVTIKAHRTCEPHNLKVARKAGQRNTIIDLECHFDYLWDRYMH